MALAPAASGSSATTPARTIPEPLPAHPGNIFLAGEDVIVPLPSRPAETWQLVDYDDRPVPGWTLQDGRAQLGRLPVGFYRLQSTSAPSADWISLGVLAPLRAPTPVTSPIALDVAAAWFYPQDKLDAAANLCALAGINWVRDRLNWSQMEPQRGQFAGANIYDASAAAQSRAGLQVLQVHHASPGWANPQRKRFPLDLRDAYRFHREMARRWQGQVRAFEPWNEADITVFGGHTGSEMASLQKAAYLGMKAGNPDVVAGLNVFAKHQRDQLLDLHANEAWPYFDTFNLHHYEAFETYPQLYADFRAVSAGRPLWVTECARPVKWAGDDQRQEPTDADLRVQAGRVAKTFALSLHEGSAATFYFLLPHYVEGQTQFGILRGDLTPRPAYLALAAVGRWLADARPLGQLKAGPTQQACLFNAQPDGEAAEVLVAWDTAGKSSLALPVAPLTIVDHLGRIVQPSTAAERTRHNVRLTTAPLFVRLPPGTAKTLALKTPPPKPARLTGEPSPIVLQSLWPEAQVFLNKSAYRLTGRDEETIPIFAYNFGATPAKGGLRVTAPAGWTVQLPASVELAPEERKELSLKLTVAASTGRLVETVRIDGDFGPAGQAVLSLRLMHPGAGTASPLPKATQAARWQPAVSGNGTLRLADTNGTLTVAAECGGADRWVYPTLPLTPAEYAPQGTEAIGLTFTLAAGTGQFRVIFEEANGSAYVADFMSPPPAGETVEAMAFLASAVHGADWSKPDPNRRLDPEKIRVLKVGCNTGAAQVQFAFGHLRWVRFH